MKVKTNKILKRAAQHMLDAHMPDIRNVEKESFEAIVRDDADIRDVNRLNAAALRCCDCAEKELAS
jgi:hypothetical protein